MSDVRWLDLLGAFSIAFFALLGLKRGLWWQFVRLSGIVACLAVARALVPRLGERVTAAVDGDERVAHGLVLCGVLGVGLLIVALCVRATGAHEEEVERSSFDRIGGALCGLLSGLLLHVALVACVAQATPRAWSLAHVRGTYSARLFDGLGRRVPFLLDARTAERLEPWFASVESAR